VLAILLRHCSFTDFKTSNAGRNREPLTKKLGRQARRNLEDGAGVARKPLKSWWVQQDSNLRPAD
jgi:hypothetical protein